jgi:hypothetical protein
VRRQNRFELSRQGARLAPLFISYPAHMVIH